MLNLSIFNYETLVHGTAGATGSIVATSLIYPLDNVKFRLQLQPELSNKSTIEALIYILKEEGLQSLYKGISPGLITLGISNFVYFYAFHGLKSLQPKGFKGSTKNDLIFSLIAGTINVLITNPLWIVSSRLKIAKNLPYSGLVDGIIYIIKNEGVKALWSSLAPSLLLVSNPVIHFTIYEAMKRRIPVKNATTFFFMAALSKAFATVLTYPLQLAQSRQRCNASDREVNVAKFLFIILQKYGLGAWFQGLEAKLLQTLLSAAIMFMTYEKIAEYVFMILLYKKK